MLLYKNARVDMKILDEVFGATNWQLIWDDDKKQWVKKQDVGTESQTEAEKGRASDSFKRACFNVGIGRELYNAPFIYIKLDKSEVKMNSKGKPTTYTRFAVNEMQYDKEKEAFVRLVIADEKGKTRYKLGEVVASPEAEKPVQKAENKYVRIENNETYVMTAINDCECKTVSLSDFFDAGYVSADPNIPDVMTSDAFVAPDDSLLQIARNLGIYIGTEK